jgi:hypothetical protein
MTDGFVSMRMHQELIEKWAKVTVITFLHRTLYN